MCEKKQEQTKKKTTHACAFFQGSYLEIKKQMDKLDPLAHPLLQW